MRPRVPEHELRDAAIVQAYLSGIDTYTIAYDFGLTRPRCSQILHEAGVEMRPWNGRKAAWKPWTTDRQFRQLVNGATAGRG